MHKQLTELPQNCNITELFTIVLKNNYYNFNSKHSHLVPGTTMGSELVTLYTIYSWSDLKGNKVETILYIPPTSNSPENIYTLNCAYNEKKYVEILLHYRQLFVKGDVFIGEWGIFGAEVFLHYCQFFI